MQPAAMQDFLDYVLRQLIDYPDEMVLLRSEGENRCTVFKVRLRQSDVGKVIGKHGHTIIAIRNLLAAAGARTGEKALLEILEEEGA
jgi:uncharacterized protein